jgi:hypothetical protein
MQLAKDQDLDVRRAVAAHPDTPIDALRQLAQDQEPHVRGDVARNPTPRSPYWVNRRQRQAASIAPDLSLLRQRWMTRSLPLARRRFMRRRQTFRAGSGPARPALHWAGVAAVASACGSLWRRYHVRLNRRRPRPRRSSPIARMPAPARAWSRPMRSLHCTPGPRSLMRLRLARGCCRLPTSCGSASAARTSGGVRRVHAMSVAPRAVACRVRYRRGNAASSAPGFLVRLAQLQ